MNTRKQLITIAIVLLAVSTGVIFFIVRIVGAERVERLRTYINETPPVATKPAAGVISQSDLDAVYAELDQLHAAVAELDQLQAAVAALQQAKPAAGKIQDVVAARHFALMDKDDRPVATLGFTGPWLQGTGEPQLRMRDVKSDMDKLGKAPPLALSPRGLHRLEPGTEKRIASLELNCHLVTHRPSLIFRDHKFPRQDIWKVVDSR